MSFIIFERRESGYMFVTRFFFWDSHRDGVDSTTQKRSYSVKDTHDLGTGRQQVGQQLSAYLCCISIV